MGEYDLFHVLAILMTLTAGCSLFNHRVLRLPPTIGVMAAALMLSLVILFLGNLGEPGQWITEQAQKIVKMFHFEDALLHVMLGFLLFGGALFVDLQDLNRFKGIILLLATIGVLVSTLIVGCLAYYVFTLLGVKIPWIYCLLFGALISPTDPIAVLSILRSAGVPKDIEVKITGESLFNDGTAVVVFLVLRDIAVGGHEVTAGNVIGMFLMEAVGGILLGLALGYLTYRCLKMAHAYQVEILLTIALVMGGYALAHELHMSGALAVVAAGLLIGNRGRYFAMDDESREHLDTFWELVDEILNAILFVLIGLEVLVFPFSPTTVVAGLLLLIVVLLARAASVAGVAALCGFPPSLSRPVMVLLTWAGLRGGISVALALSLPQAEEFARQMLVTISYMIVVFSIGVQGLTVARVAQAVLPSARNNDAPMPQ